MALQSPLIWLQETNTDVWEYLMITLVKVRKNKVIEQLDEKWGEYYGRFAYLRNKEYIIEKDFNPGRFMLISRIFYKTMKKLDWIFKPKIFIYGIELVPKYYINRRIFTENGLTYINVSLQYKDVFGEENPINFINNLLDSIGIHYERTDTNDGGLMKFLCELEDHRL